jgi:hypothetical protein
MTKDEIVKLAIEAGFEIDLEAICIASSNDSYTGVEDELLRFAALVAEKATEQANARQNASWARMCEKMVAAERQECVKILYDNASKSRGMAVHALIANAQQIEARGQKEYRGARLVLTKDGVIQDGWMGDE